MADSKTDPKVARKAMLSDAMEGTGTDVPLSSPPVTQVLPPMATVLPAPTGLSPEVMAILNALASGQASQAEGLKSLMEQMAATMTEQTRLAREPIPENKVAPNMSVFNPLGERDHPRDGLKCPMYLGQYDENGTIQPAYPIVEDACTRAEQDLCNALEQGEAQIERNDGNKGRVVIQARRDGAGRLDRLVIALPYGWMSKEFQAQLPSFKRLLTAIVEQQQTVAA